MLTCSKVLNILSICCISFSWAYAQDPIIKIDTIADVFEYIEDENTLIFFDIDLTLGIPYPHPRGSYRLYLIEKNSPLIIHHLHKMGVKACALTDVFLKIRIND